MLRAKTYWQAPLEEKSSKAPGWDNGAMQSEPVIVLAPETAKPLLLDSPHSGTQYPPDFNYCVPLQWLRDAEDTHVESLYAPWVEAGATLIAAQFPRSYVDCNRAASDIDAQLLDAPWPDPIAPTRKSELGKGLVWRCLDDGTPIYERKLSVTEVQQRINAFWQPYWQAITSQSEALYATHGRLYHINCHSMPGKGAPFAFDAPSAELPDFVLGDRDSTTCAPEYAAFVMHTLREMGYQVSHNTPYKGVELVRYLGRPQAHRHSIQLEINRKLYMDELTRELNGGAEKLVSDLQKLCAAIVDRFAL